MLFALVKRVLDIKDPLSIVSFPILCAKVPMDGIESNRGNFMRHGTWNRCHTSHHVSSHRHMSPCYVMHAPHACNHSSRWHHLSSHPTSMNHLIAMQPCHAYHLVLLLWVLHACIVYAHVYVLCTHPSTHPSIHPSPSIIHVIPCN